MRVVEDAAADAQRLNKWDRKPTVEIIIVDTILEALRLAVPPAQGDEPGAV